MHILKKHATAGPSTWSCKSRIFYPAGNRTGSEAVLKLVKTELKIHYPLPPPIVMYYFYFFI